MKNVCLGAALCSLAMIMLSCGTVKETRQTEEKQAQTWEYENIRFLDGNCKTEDFPLLGFNNPPDGMLRTPFAGKIVNDSFNCEELDIFDGRLIIQMEAKYVLYDKEQNINYYVLIFDFNKSLNDGTNVAAGDIIGRIDDRKAKLVVFSESLEPYLLNHSNEYPVFYGGYYWFSAAFMTSPGSARWLSFDPVNDMEAELIEIADHVTSEPPGLSLYNKWVRFKVMLTEYPREISEEEFKSISVYERYLSRGNRLTYYVSDMYAGGYSYLLCWQKGFLDYLKKEYSLNDEMWLYGVISTYDVWSRQGFIFIRDFTLMSMEEMYEGRLKILKGL